MCMYVKATWLSAQELRVYVSAAAYDGTNPTPPIALAWAYLGGWGTGARLDL